MMVYSIYAVLVYYEFVAGFLTIILNVSLVIPEIGRLKNGCLPVENASVIDNPEVFK